MKRKRLECIFYVSFVFFLVFYFLVTKCISVSNYEIIIIKVHQEFQRGYSVLNFRTQISTLYYKKINEINQRSF